MTRPEIRIATRSSKLALWQAAHVKSLIEEAAPDFVVEIVHVSTVGDQNQTDPLRQFGGTGVFTREVQSSVLRKDTDIAVHSLKDLPTQSAEGLLLAGVPDRETTADALLLPDRTRIKSLDDLPEGSRIGTGSPRRQAQLLHVRPDLNVLEIRGNVDTRIRKLDDGDYDAIVLAEAGLRRLGLEERISLSLCAPLVFPAVGQGAIGIECRSDDQQTADVLSQITNENDRACTIAERALLAELRAGCHAPLGVRTKLVEGVLTLTAVILSVDGAERLEAESESHVNAAEALGIQVAQDLLKEGGQRLVEGV